VARPHAERRRYFVTLSAANTERLEAATGEAPD
jgi:hypothetical protein